MVSINLSIPLPPAAMAAPPPAPVPSPANREKEARNREGHKLADPRGLKINWEKQSPQELAQLLADERHTVRQQAMDSLAQRGAQAVPSLKQVF